MPDRLDLYEACVQRPEIVAAFLHAVHGSSPTALREDFCGTAAISRSWLAIAPAKHAVAVDLDASSLQRAGERLGSDRLRCELLCADALRAHTAEASADVVFVGNFSIGYIHRRSTLVEYFRRSRSRLKPGGIFVCDTYDSPTAFTTGSLVRDHHAPGIGHVRYIWEQRQADRLTARVQCVLHFRVLRGGEVTHEYTDAFIYNWRLWSIAELREAMQDAGFAKTEVHQDLGQFPVAVQASVDLHPAGIVCIVARTD